MKELAQAEESLFWYWINERHAIYLLRAEGRKKPWTADPILRDYKFTNAFRQLDRGTVWLTENFIKPHWDDDAGLLVGNIAWYRQFNLWKTGELLGWQTDWNPGIVRMLLAAAMNRGEQVFTNAHIVWSEPGMSKIDAVVDYATSVWEDRGVLAALCETLPPERRCLEDVFERLLKHRGVGDFIAYEIVTDLRHTRLLNQAKDIMEWANPGPGAIRGLRRLGLSHRPRVEAIRSMRTLLKRSQEPGVLADWVPPLEMRDIEHSLCEFDKYVRVLKGEGEPRMRFNGGA